MIALYHGKSPISRIIRAFNWSDVSHAAWIDPGTGGQQPALLPGQHPAQRPAGAVHSAIPAPGQQPALLPGQQPAQRPAGAVHSAIPAPGQQPAHTVIEAWHKGGVTRVPSLSTNHTPGTRIDLYTVIGETPAHTAIIRDFLHAQLGKPYDYLGLFGFLFRATRLQDKHKWFCSELVAEAYATAALPLMRIPSHKIYPGMLAASPMLKHIGGTVTT